uniref:alpha-amylase family glycosyl hydrolase n=1 Tax=Salmonella enterica TaxID=28901 RepID=UPI00398C6417
EHQMRRDDKRRGWWLSDIEKTPGQCYGFSLYDGESWTAPLPDPRSARQPDGVHGLSQVTDPEFEWSDQDWTRYELKGQVIYELHVGTFSEEGTFDGVVDKLDYLADLGVTTIELMPVQPFAGERNWG